MAICRKRENLIFKLIVYLIVSSSFRFPFLVLASDSDPYSISDKSTSTDVENSSPDPRNGVEENPNNILLSKNELQLKKLEELVQNLGQLIARLESRFDDSRVEVNEEGLAREERVPLSEGTAFSVKKYNALWTERFHFISAVKLRSSPTCINLLPFRDSEGFTKYFAVGDEKGRVYVFSRSGDISLEFNAFLDYTDGSRITSMVSYSSVYKNETLIITGHENGNIVKHRIWETSNEELSLLHVDRVVRFETPETSNAKIGLLEVHNIGRRRYILAINGDGNIIVLAEDGKLYGVASLTARPIAFLKQRLLFLTKSGAGSLDLRTMKIKEAESEGLNGSFVENYVFDAMDRSKAYGFTSEGDLIQTILLGDAKNFKCRIRSKRKLDLDHPLALQTIKGYLLITDNKNVVLYNISSQHYVRGSGVKLMFSTSTDEIMSSFSNQQRSHHTNRITVPLIASDNDKHILIHVGNEYIALYRSKLPGFKNEFNSILWTSPILFFILFLFGAWHFFANKKEALTSWGPDDPFNSSVVTNGTPSSVSPPGTDVHSSRNSEIMELRGSGLRGSSSSYVSPQRYASAGLETDLISASPLKFRGSNVEAAKRRDGLFGNSQGVDGGSHYTVL